MQADDREPRLEALASLVVANARVGISITDAAGRILFVNRAFTEVTGYAAEEVIGQNPRLLQSGRHPRAYYEDMWRALLERGSWQGEIWNRRKSGEEYPEWLSIVAVRDDAGAVTHYCAIFSDISERKRAEETLTHLALHDALTDLPNRALFIEHLRHALHRQRRDGGRLAVLFLDLDGFKAINDDWGHEAGDAVLRATGERVRAWLRTSDVVARYGGDEFTVLLDGIRGAWQAADFAKKLEQEVGRPITMPVGECRVGVSIGLAIFPDDAIDEVELLRLADQRMYQEKRRHLRSRGTGRRG